MAHSKSDSDVMMGIEVLVLLWDEASMEPEITLSNPALAPKAEMEI